MENLRVSFKEMVNEADWIEPVTKVEAIAKADAIRRFLCFLCLDIKMIMLFLNTKSRRAILATS